MNLNEKNRCELHVHTNKTKLKGVVPVCEYIKKAREFNMSSLAITDYNSVESFFEISKMSESDLKNFKIIYGAEINVFDNDDVFNVMLLVKDKRGFKNLNKLVSLSNESLVSRDILKKFRDGLLIGSTSIYGEVYQKFLKNIDKFDDDLLMYDYFEIAPRGNSVTYSVSDDILKEDVSSLDGEVINKKIVELGSKMDILVVVSSDSYYISDLDYQCFNLITSCAKLDNNNSTTSNLFFRSTDDMLLEFSYLGDSKSFEVVVLNTNKISDMCDNVAPFVSMYNPVSIGDSLNFFDLVNEKLLDVVSDDVLSYVNFELDLIKSYNLESLYMGMHKFFENLNVGLVSVDGFFSSSYVAYLLGIINIDPLDDKFGLSCYDGNFFKNSIENKFLRINCSSLNVLFLQKRLKKIFEDNCVYPLCKSVNYSFSDVKMYSSFLNDPCSDIAETYYKNVYSKMVYMKKGSSLLKNTFGIFKNIDDVYNFNSTLLLDGEVVLNDDGSKFSNFLKIEICPKDNFLFLDELVKATDVSLSNIDVFDESVLSLFYLNEDTDLKEILSQYVVTAGIFNFNSSFMTSLLIDLNVSSFAGLVKCLNLSKCSNVWFNNDNVVYSPEFENLSSVISSLGDIVNYLSSFSISKDVSSDIAYYACYKKNFSSDIWTSYKKIMVDALVPSSYIDVLSSNLFLSSEHENVFNTVCAIMLSWFKLNYPLEFYSVYFSNFDNLNDKSWVNLSKDDINCKMIFGHKYISSQYRVLYEMFKRDIIFLNFDVLKSDLVNFIPYDGNILIPLKYVDFDFKKLCNYNDKDVRKLIEHILKN